MDHDDHDRDRSGAGQRAAHEVAGALGWSIFSGSPRPGVPISGTRRQDAAGETSTDGSGDPDVGAPDGNWSTELGLGSFVLVGEPVEDVGELGDGVHATRAAPRKIVSTKRFMFDSPCAVICEPAITRPCASGAILGSHLWLLGFNGAAWELQRPARQRGIA